MAWADLRQGRIYEQTGRFDLAAFEYFDTLRKGAKDGDKIQAEFELASSLQTMKLFYSASYYFGQVLVNHSGPNPYRARALEALTKIDAEYPLGPSFMQSLLAKGLDPNATPEASRAFFYYYLGKDQFAKSHWGEAKNAFARITLKSPFFVKASFHLGIIQALENEPAKAIRSFHNVIRHANRLGNAEWLREQATINIARIHYEAKDFVRAIASYAKIPRNSDNWLTALFEASWAFFLMEKPNNTLGNIHTLHSPFFDNRFFPESYILQAVTFLRLCQFEQVKNSVDAFKTRYTPVLSELSKILDEAKTNPNKMVDWVRAYNSQSLQVYRNAWPIFDALARTDVARQMLSFVANVDKELLILEGTPEAWRSTGLRGTLNEFLNGKKAAIVKDAGRALYQESQFYLQYLSDLSEQTKLIHAELMLGKIEQLRRKLQIRTTPKKENFIGGMQPLVIGQNLEYWPFEGEYWEDELGGYVYNIESQCKK